MVGWSFIIKAAQSWNLTSTYTELLAKVHYTYSTSTYNFKWPVPRTYASAYCFNLRIQLRISLTGPCHVLKTHMYVYFTWSVPYIVRTQYYNRFFLIEYVELMCSRVRILL